MDDIKDLDTGGQHDLPAKPESDAPGHPATEGLREVGPESEVRGGPEAPAGSEADRIA